MVALVRSKYRLHVLRGGSIFLNIIFQEPMGRLKLELIYYFTYFSNVVPSNSCVFLSCRPVHSILLNIMLHAPMGRFQLELIYFFTYFSTVVPSNKDGPVGLSTFSTGFLGIEVSFVSWLGTYWKCRINDERPTGIKHTTVGWDDGGKIGKIIN